MGSDMTKKGESRRVKMTRRLLQEALLQLMEEKPVERITITELCAAADVNRNTFYAHYSIPEDVLEELEDSLFDDVERMFNEVLPADINLALCQYMYENRDVCRVLLASPSGHITKRLQMLGRSLSDKEWGAVHPSFAGAADEFFTFASAGSAAVISQWLERGCRETPEQVSWFLNRIITDGAKGFFNAT